MNKEVSYSEIKIIGTMFFSEKTWLLGMSELLDVEQSLLIEWDELNVIPDEIKDKLASYTYSKIHLLSNLQSKLEIK